MIRDGSASEAEALTIRGLAEAGLEEVGPARRDLERAWQLQPNAAAARVLAAIYLSACENERGFQMLMNAARIEPEDFRPWYAMGELVHLRLRHYEPAIAAFQQALKRHPGHLESRIGLIDALVKSHRPADAEPILSGVLAERPGDPRVAALAAEVALELGRDQDAARFLQRSLAIAPDHREALILQARLQLRLGHPRDALAAAERACALEPNDSIALGLLGSIQAALGLKNQAARTQISATWSRSEVNGSSGCSRRSWRIPPTRSRGGASARRPPKPVRRTSPSRATRRPWPSLPTVCRRARASAPSES